ncbi:HTH domain-containing protein [Allokutzneria sp. A3M-2-11 16]|uniref:helix-turn-helix transcriptional regulator n=1 Tax=Allokutzneria sp. A3M-2-11 16 TaxID=2962043 RepID=UPI0020B65EC1|nr:HTH domain-containing protein [Allokutzneria sp. A3M-2-11 16]MCP3803714.1 HTH domain-containing protein [Allokutzneria sp. A3M-2-11 16]
MTYEQVHLGAPLVERQHRLIEELRASAARRLSGETLARRLGVSVRTVERDVARLVEAGVPIRVRRGPRGGYAFDGRNTVDPVALTPGEIAALVAAVVAVGPYSSATARSALDKLLAALSPNEGQTRDISRRPRRGSRTRSSE